VKKKWAKPALIVIARSDPQEHALALCKTATSGGGAAAADGICTFGIGCDVCSGRLIS